jgi:PAS domain S-box-containing protein
MRLGLSFAAVLLLLLLTYYVGVTRLSSINGLMKEINETNIPETVLASSMLTAVQKERVEIRNIILLTEDDKLAKAKARFEVDRQEFDTAESSLDKMFAESATTNDTERRLAAKLKEIKPVFTALQGKVIALGMVNKNSEATAILYSEGYSQTVSGLIQTLDDLTAFENKDNKETGDSASALAKSAIRTLTVAVVGAILLAIVTALLVTRSIRNPLLEVVIYFDEIRKGNFKNDIEITSTDEIGAVLAALKATQQTLLDASIKAADHQGQIAAISKAQAVIEFELDGTVRTANDNFLTVLGYRLDDVKGKNHSLFVDPGYRDSTEYRQFWEKMRRGEYEAGMYRRIGQGGREVWLQASYNPIVGLDGKPYKVVKYATDVTEQVKMKQGLDDAMVEQAQMKEALDGAVADTQAIVKAAIAGDLISRIPTQGKTGEIVALCEGINTLLDATMKLITNVKAAAQEVQSGAEEISRGNTDLSQRTEEQASSLEETASSMEEMTSSVKQTADNAGQANQLAVAARQQAEREGQSPASP